MAIMPSSVPAIWTGAPVPFPFHSPLLVDVDDLNRLTLAATCEVLPACRDRGVTLMVGLAAEAIQVRGASDRLEHVLACLIEEASRVATTTGMGARVRVTTRRDETHGEIRVVTAGVTTTGLCPEIIPAAARVLREHGGTLRIVEEPAKRLTMKVRLPVVDPGKGGLEARIEPPPPSAGRIPDDADGARLPPAGQVDPVPAVLEGAGRPR